MTGKRSGWIGRRGQADADQAIDQVIDQRPQQGEQVQQLPDGQIEDSPYQARRQFDDQSVEELAQGMRESGFQGVLIVRPHSDVAERRRGMVQLVYGHRRRVAWRQVCAEGSEPCLLPVVIREIDDTRMLTIGAQENLQRQDLDPTEEAQIVAWHQQMYFDKNQAEIGLLLGKSEDWVKTRSRVHKLPDALKERLRQRPRAISQMLDLGTLYVRQPDVALTLADRVVQEQMTLDAVRAAVRDYMRPTSSPALPRDEKHNQRGAALIVKDGTIQAEPERSDRENQHNQRGAALIVQEITSQVDISWLPPLCNRLSQTTDALRKVRGEIAQLGDQATITLSTVVEELLRELALVTQVIEQRGKQ